MSGAASRARDHGHVQRSIAPNERVRTLDRTAGLAVVALAGPLLGVLALQVVAAVVFIFFVVFRLMKSDYTAAVLSAGFAGFALGATPTAIANMSSVTKRYGPAPLAFILLPLVSAFFVDLANAFIIRFFVAL